MPVEVIRSSDEQRDRIRRRVRALSPLPLREGPHRGQPTGLHRLVAVGWTVIYQYDQAADIVTTRDDDVLLDGRAAAAKSRTGRSRHSAAGSLTSMTSTVGASQKCVA